MKRVSVLMTAMAVMLLVAGTVAADPREPNQGGIVTDDPSGVEPVTGLDGDGIAAAEAFLGFQPPAPRTARSARNISLVGALKLEPFNLGVHGDVAGYKNLAFVGKWREACPGTGVDIIDISRPSAPVKIADTRDHPDTSMEDMQVLEVGGRPVLGVGLQDCNNDPTPGVGRSGLELYDISNPRSPQLLSFFDVDQFGADVTGVHELDLTTTPSGRALALLAVPNLEALTFPSPSTGDLLIVDITNPASPVLVGEWGPLDEPSLGVAFYNGVQQGGDARTLGHSARANADGTRVYVSYWDAGFITLDISDPASPVFRGFAPRTAPNDSYAAGEEGNAHSVAEARDGQLLVGADEDFTPFHLEFQVTAPASIAGQYPALEAVFTPPIVEQPGRSMSGEVVHVGRGCPPGTPGLPGGDPYLADPAGKIALIVRGLCRFDNKIAWAQLNGAVGAIVYNNTTGQILMGGDNPVQQGSPAVIGTQITIPGISVEQTTGLAMVNALDSGEVVTVDASAVFDGWGFLRFFDLRDPANPVQVGTFATANTFNEAVALEGTWSVHNPEIRGSTVYASWYSDGVRVIDITRPSAAREMAFWAGAGAPADAPAVNIWSVVPHGDLLLASDRNFGLYVLKLKP
jgi:hypothetical protein